MKRFWVWAREFFGRKFFFHASFAAVVTGGVILFVGPRWWTPAAALLFVVWKETMDRKLVLKVPAVADFVIDVLGYLAGAVISLAFFWLVTHFGVGWWQ